MLEYLDDAEASAPGSEASSLTLVPFEGAACTVTLVRKGADLEAHQPWSSSRTRLDATLEPQLLPNGADFLDPETSRWPGMAPEGR